MMTKEQFAIWTEFRREHPKSEGEGEAKRERKYSIMAKNRQGATKGFVGTIAEIEAWVKGWDDPENLSFVVESSERPEPVAWKEFGRKRLDLSGLEVWE